MDVTCPVLYSTRPAGPSERRESNVISSHVKTAHEGEQADLQASQDGNGGTANVEEAARVISKAFTNCITDRSIQTLEQAQTRFINAPRTSGNPLLQNHGGGAYIM